jgi:hypothetical protein
MRARTTFLAVMAMTILAGCTEPGPTTPPALDAEVLPSTAAKTMMQKLCPPDVVAYDRFGFATALDGDTAMIGAIVGDGAAPETGCVYAFVRTGDAWVQQQKLAASDVTESFGFSLSISDDAVLIGAPLDDETGYDRGAAYVFVRAGGVWTQAAKILAPYPPGSGCCEGFGQSVSLDGETALIGAPYDDDHGLNAGSAYVYVRAGAAWIQQAKLLAPDGDQLDWFGDAVSLAGNTALVAARSHGAGAVYVFTHAGESWTLEAELTAAGAYQFGSAVSLEGDTALIGSDGDDCWNGAAYVFVRTGSTWALQQRLVAADAGLAWFGTSVSLAGDVALIGADWECENGYVAGAAYVFRRYGGLWEQEMKLTPRDGFEHDGFGTSVSLAGGTAIIGAEGDTDHGFLAGSAYVVNNVFGPDADITWGPEFPRRGEVVTFDGAASHDPDGPITWYEWDWEGDGTFDEGRDTPIATHSWSSTGLHAVTLRVTSQASEADTATILLKVRPRPFDAKP